MNRLLAAAALALLTTVATCKVHAHDLNIRFGALPPIPYSMQPDARIIQVPEPIGEAERIEKQVQERAWERYCAPYIRRDELGVGHYVYLHKSCDFGATED